MTIILGYTLTETIYKNLYSKACLAVRENETRPVLLRLPIGGNEKDFSANQLRQELRAVQKHEFPARANYREIFLSNGGFLLETDTYGFVPISKLFTGKGFKPELFFAAAIDITKNLEILHHHKKVLGCLRAEAILLEPRQKKVLFTEFSGLVSLKTPGIPNMSGKSPTEDLTGIMYLSPEQNGCLNKPVDCRSDLYSLGVLFYRMLTGVLPYRGNSVLELYHALTAGTFIPPHRANPKVPEALSRIVLRLLERDPDSRYQSAYGLRKDLEKCLEYWERENRIPRFTLAMHDVKTTSRAVEGFYGRQYELQIMQQKLKNAACGSAGILFLEGEAGIGKTALTRHFEKKSREDGALFASGKSSPIKNGLPYKPLAEAFQQLFQWVMGGSEEEVARWKEEFRKRSPVLFLLTGIMPYLEYFLGNNTAPGDLGDNDIEERFFSAFYSLISIFTAGKGPLVLFLDDLQWADRGTLSIIEALFTRFKIKNLLLIGAYRNEEVSEGHPLKNVMESIKDSGTNITTLRLKPLALEDLIRMTADNLECDSKEAVPLARFIFEKTQGNPLFSKEVIQSMLKENLIIFGPGGGWNWDLEKLKEANLSDDIIVFLEQRIKLLPSSTLSLLKYAACIGNPFSIDMLAKVTNKSPSETEEKLNLCIMEGLIQREEDKSYSFIHDRIWQTVYLLIPNSQKPAFHYRLGSLLLQVLEETADAGVKDPALLFSAANQLNLGTEWIKNGNERLKAAELNLKAGEKAKKSAAFTTALDYLRSGLGLLNEMAWEDCYRLAFGLNSAYLECLYLCGYYERADSIYDTLMERVKDRMDRVRLRTLKILFYTKKNFSRETIRIALEGLRELGLIIPEKPSMLNITSQLLKVSIMLGRVGIQNIATLPDADDTEKKAAMDLLIALGPSAYNLDSTLLMAISLKICELSLRYGNFSNSASAYITLAMVFTVQFKFYRWGKGLADTALELAEKSRSDSVKTTVNFIYGAFCGPWHNHAKGSLGYLERAKEYGFASSDLMYAGFAMTFEVINLHFTGITFSVLLERINKSLGYATRIKDPYYAYTLTVYKQFIRSLRGLTPEPGSFGNKTLRDEDFVTSLGGVMVRERDKFDYYLMKGEACYILGQYDRAAAMLEQADRLSKLYFGEVYLSDLDLYYCLTQIARFKQLGLGERMKKWLKLHKRRRRLRNWAQHCPENFLHKSLLVEAELARVRGKHGRSFSLYQQAIGCAKKNGFLQDYAIGCECAANYFLSRGFGDLAGKYMTDALEGYRDWGAAAKVWQLKESHSMLLDRAYIDDTAATQETETMVEETREFTKMVDVESIVRAAEVLSGEIVLEELLKKMMGIVLQNAGATKGILLLQRDGRLFIEAEVKSRPGGYEVRLLNSTALEDDSLLPRSVVNYVARTAEEVVLGNAAREGIFSGDPYIAKNKTASVLCLPIISQGRTVGVLYLENSGTIGGFSPKRVKTLKLLSGHIAASIENAVLYRRLQDLNAGLEVKVRERTEELARFQQETIEALARQSKLQERNRIAREIHDTVGHTLTSVLIQVEAGKKLIKKDTGLAVEKLEQSLEQVRAGLDEVRRSIHLLGERDSEERVQTMEGFLQDIIRNTGISVKSSISGEKRLNPAQRHVLYRVMQEGITNGIRHGGSNTFELRLETEKDRFKFVLRDFGIGTDEIKPGFGLMSMKERVEILGGSLKLISRMGEGFCILIYLPLDADN